MQLAFALVHILYNTITSVLFCAYDFPGSLILCAYDLCTDDVSGRMILAEGMIWVGMIFL